MKIDKTLRVDLVNLVDPLLHICLRDEILERGTS